MVRAGYQDRNEGKIESWRGAGMNVPETGEKKNILSTKTGCTGPQWEDEALTRNGVGDPEQPVGTCGHKVPKDKRGCKSTATEGPPQNPTSKQTQGRHGEDLQMRQAAGWLRAAFKGWTQPAASKETKISLHPKARKKSSAQQQSPGEGEGSCSRDVRVEEKDKLNVKGLERGERTWDLQQMRR